MKKLLVGAASAAMFLSVAMPALANGRHHQQQPTTNVATIQGNNVVVVANTGLNTQNVNGGSTSTTQYMDTGSAIAVGKQVVVANVSADCGCEEANNTAIVRNNNVVVVANTGLNAQRATSAPVVETNHHRHHTSPSVTTEQTMFTGDVGASGTQWVVTNVSL